MFGELVYSCMLVIVYIAIDVYTRFHMQIENVTNVIYVCLGSQNAKVKEAGHDQCPSHGKGSHYVRNDAERLFRQLIVDGFLDEEIHVTPQDFTLCYVKLGKRAPDILNGRIKVIVEIFLLF